MPFHVPPTCPFCIANPPASWSPLTFSHKYTIQGAIFNCQTQPGVPFQFMTEDEIRFSHLVCTADLLAFYWLKIAMYNLFFILSKNILCLSSCLWVIDILRSVKILLSQKLGALHFPEGVWRGSHPSIPNQCISASPRRFTVSKEKLDLHGNS